MLITVYILIHNLCIIYLFRILLNLILMDLHSRAILALMIRIVLFPEPYSPAF